MKRIAICGEFQRWGACSATTSLVSRWIERHFKPCPARRTWRPPMPRVSHVRGLLKAWKDVAPEIVVGIVIIGIVADQFA